MTGADKLFAGGEPRNPAGRTADRDFPSDIPRDRWKRPLIAVPGRDGLMAYTRASTLGGTLEDQFGLGQWRMRQVAVGLARRRDLVLEAASLRTGDLPADKKQLDSICERALEAAESSAKATIGTAIHALTDRMDSGEDVPDQAEFQPTLDAYAEIASHFTMHQIEAFVVWDAVRVAGTFDRLVAPKTTCIAPDGTPFGPEDRIVWDLKTSATADYFGIKFAVQLACYANAVPYSHEHGRSEWEVAPDTRWGIICHAPSGGDTATLHWVNLERGAELVHKAIDVREERKAKDLVVPWQSGQLPRVGREPIASPEQLGQAALLGTRLTILNALRRANSREVMLQVREQALARGAWTDDLDDVARRRVAELNAMQAADE